MKIFEGIVVASDLKHTAIIEVSRTSAHPIYKKLLKKSKRYKVDIKGVSVAIGEKIRVIETRPLSKDKHFAVLDTNFRKEQKA